MPHEFAMNFLSNIKNQRMCFCSWGQALDPHSCPHDPQVKKAAPQCNFTSQNFG